MIRRARVSGAPEPRLKPGAIGADNPLGPSSFALLERWFVMTVASRDPRGSRRPRPDPIEALAEDSPALEAARLWVHRFARTLKTCRLYEANNPTVARFLVDLADTLDRFIEEHGALTLRFTADDVLFDGASVYLARSREDNLALPFYRDGIRALTLNPGIAPGEVQALIRALVSHATVANPDGDLVTTLWEAQLDHVDLDYVPAESEVVAGDEATDAEPMPWPEDDPEAEAEAAKEVVTEDDASRSDDWTIRERTAEVEAGFEELDTLAENEIKRFHDEYRDEHQVPLTTTAIAIVQAYLAAGVSASETLELARFLPRVLREALDEGRWIESAVTIGLLESHGHGQWSLETFAQELLQPISVSQLAARLDVQDADAVLDFVDLAHRVGELEVDVLVGVLAQSEYRRTRRLLSEAVVRSCRDNPERLAPWLADPRWQVVRNVVHMLGMIGGPAVVPLLETVAQHPEPRVRYAVVASLGESPPGQSRELLIGMLEGADSRTFCSVMQQLGRERDPELARRLFAMMLEPEFERRPGPDKRAVYHALGITSTDEIVPELEAELNRGGWFALQLDEHRIAIARCLARIGTLDSMRALERGAQSKRAAVRKACEEALLGWAPHE